jgi:hypothetical protein
MMKYHKLDVRKKKKQLLIGLGVREVQNQGIERVMLFLSPLGEAPSLHLPGSDSDRNSFQSSMTLLSTSIFSMVFSLCFSLHMTAFFLRRTAHITLGVYLIYYDFILTSYIYNLFLNMVTL